MEREIQNHTGVYWQGPHIKGFNEASASKSGNPPGILIMATVYFKYKYPREAFFTLLSLPV